MNAKKIMGAVLVAFLAAALFVGAGAAATVFVNENVTQTQKTALANSGTWSNGDAYVTIGANGIVVPGPNFVPGTYKKGEDTLFVTNPSAVITGVVGAGYEAYPFIGANIYQNTPADEIELSVASASENVTIDGLYVTFPDGSNQLLQPQDLIYELAGNNATLGVYKVQALFNYTNFTKGILLDKLLSEVATINVVEEGAGTISAAADSVLKSETIKLVITGQPGKTYNVTFDTAYLFNATENQLIKTEKVDGKLQFEMPNTGKVDLSIKANATATEKVGSSEKITLQWNANGKAKQASVVINFAKGTISAKTEAASYFVGDQVKVIVTSTAGIPTSYMINGTNFGYVAPSPASNWGGWKVTGDSVKTIEFSIPTDSVASQETATLSKKMDVGTYTVTIIVDAETKTTVPLTLKQPFISIAEAPEVIVQGEDDVEFIINAEATEDIGYYIFGTNYFKADQEVDDHPSDEDGELILNQFVIALGAEDSKNMSA
ncbi:hypothetical protein J5991_07510, partial [Methanocorpusculum sp.]|nr:hypothetical protein [Methanocorpusculum sp.]